MTQLKQHVLVAINPKSGSGMKAHLIDQILDELRVHGFECQTVADLQQLKELATQRSADGSLRCVIACGGDGTVSAVASHVPKSIPIALFPLGTENLLARQLGAAPSPSRLAGAITAGYLKKYDAAKINGDLWSLMVGVGFDAEVVKRVHLGRRGHITKLAYGLPILAAIATYRYPPIRCRFHGIKVEKSNKNSVVVDPLEESRSIEDGVGSIIDGGQEFDFESRWVFLVNQPRYAGEISFSPSADPHDGLIDVCCFDKGGLFNGLRYLTALWQNRVEHCSGYSLYRTASLSLECKSHASYQRDGDYGGSLPATVSMDRDRLNFVVPFETSDQIGN